MGKIKTQFNKNYQKSLSIILALSLLFVSIPHAQAASLSTLSDTMTRIKVSTLSNHTLVFTTPTGIAGAATLVVTFPDGTANGFVGQSGIDYTDVDLQDDGSDVTLAASPTGTTWGAAFSGTNLNVLTFTNGSAAVAASSIITIKIGTNATSGTTGDKQITNPNTSGSKTITINGTFGDTGSIAVPIATDDQVVVSASVDPSITFQLSTNSASLGTMTTGAVASTSAVTLTMGTNAAGGYTVTIQDQGNGTVGGLYKSSVPTKNITSGTATLSAGTEGYGAQGTTGTGSPTISSPYNTSGNGVGQLQRTAQSFITYGSPTGVTNQTSTVTFKAAISASTPAGSYADTITLLMTGNF
ncbi:MAG: hypothetical protein PHU86_02530 [Patescibacteria group bacterium]|nr:hypothetical protein [Patescibacteria group bacterium]